VSPQVVDRGTITFYEVGTDPDRYQYFLLEEIGRVGLLSDGRPWEDNWLPPKVFSFQPRLREGDFWDFGLGAVGKCFAVRPEALQRTEVSHFLNSAGELLALPYLGREFKVLNITECIDALDHERTTYREDMEFDEEELDELDDETRRLIEEEPSERQVKTPVFRLDRLGWQLFKVPETAITKIYYWERSEDDPEQQFRPYCQTQGLTGLTFTPIYSIDSVF
jgi:hypothetical protein